MLVKMQKVTKNAVSGQEYLQVTRDSEICFICEDGLPIPNIGGVEWRLS